VLVDGKVDANTDGATVTRYPINVYVLNALPGFDAEATAMNTNNEAEIGLDLYRKAATLLWAFIMMGIFWLLSISAAAVVVATVFGIREFETRHLAWLAAMIFAFAAFRNTAPGNPPIGVYLDYAAFFWAELLVALSLLTLVSYYLTAHPREVKPT
jgi:hypothetical protein